MILMLRTILLLLVTVLTFSDSIFSRQAFSPPRDQISVQHESDAHFSEFHFTLPSSESTVFNDQETELPELFLNEILTSNVSSIEDEDGANAPWVELYNAGDSPLNLRYIGLSNDPDRPWRWIFPDITIEPDEHLVVFLSGKNRTDPQNPLHTGFRIDPYGGDELALVDMNGRVIDKIPPVPMETDVSRGRLPDGSDHFTYFENPTPGWPNTADDFPSRLDPPDFSRDGGFYTSAFELELATSTPGAVIRYTLDGSIPDSTSKQYSEPIRIENRSNHPNSISTIPTSPPMGDRLLGYEWIEPEGNIFKGTVVRARSFRSNSRPSPVITHTYFVDDQSPHRYPLAIVSLSTDSLNLFDYESGIYVPGKKYDDQEGDDHLIGNYAERGHEWEHPASFELFDEQGVRVHSQNIGLRIHGGASRSLPQKSLRLYARHDYGRDRIDYPVFPDQTDRNYQRLILRNSGQDFFVRSTMFRDAFMQSLVKDFNFDTQAYRPAIVFINGEFWGIQNIRERYDEYYVARTYGVDPDNIDLLTDNAEVRAGDDEHYQLLLQYLGENDLKDDRHYDQVKTMMDVDNFLDYIITQVFVRNIDWPGNNNDYWRLRTAWSDQAPTGHDGRWRWLLVDTDAGFGLMNPWRVASYDMIRHITNDTYETWPNPTWSTFIIRRLFENENFRTEFIRRSADYLNTVFRPDHVITLINEFENRLDPVIEEHIHRWGQIESKDQWYFNVQRLRNFAEDRPGYIYQHIAEYFNLKGQVDITVDVSALDRGRIQINHLTLDENTPGISGRKNVYPWKGSYFRDIPVKLIARPYHGYTFSHWEGNGIDESLAASDTLIIKPASNMSVKAVFIHDEEPLEMTPEAYPLAEMEYHFLEWDADSKPGTWPDHMAFQYLQDEDPLLDSPVAGFTSGAYNLSSGTRINGLGNKGFSFFNSSEFQKEPGYPDRRLGAAVLALDTREMKNITVSWTGGTVTPGSKKYKLRLQYRINGEGLYHDVPDEQGEPVVYLSESESGHSRRFEEIPLPASVENKPYVELRWLYYYSGRQLDSENDERDNLRVSDIHVQGTHTLHHNDKTITGFEVLPSYPNPFNNAAILQFYLPEETLVSITIFDVNGRRIRRLFENIRLTAGHHTVPLDAAGMASGMYIYRIETSDWTGIGKMSLIR